MKSVTVFTVSPSISHEVVGPDGILVFRMLSFKPTFSLSSFTFIQRLFSSSLLSAIRVVSSVYLSGLKLNIQKMKIMASGLIISWQIDIDGETTERVTDFIFLAPESLQMVIAAMKLKDTCSLEGKL